VTKDQPASELSPVQFSSTTSVTEMTEKILYRKDGIGIASNNTANRKMTNQDNMPSSARLSNDLGVDLGNLQERIKGLEKKIDEDNRKMGLQQKENREKKASGVKSTLSAIENKNAKD
jgi:hypothetical protein